MNSGTTAAGSNVTGANGLLTFTIPDAFYTGGKTATAVDSNLQPGNIKNGVSIFGVSGTANVADTTVATDAATAADIRFGKKAYINGVLVTGTLFVAACPSGWSGANCDTISKPFTAGAVPTYASTPWKCVSDSTTGLVWEVKTTDGGLHDWNHTYTWYDSTYTADPGTANGGTCNGSDCDTENLVAAVNAEQLCGHTNWRMPSFSELQGLVVARRTPSIDTAYFPNTVDWVYWSGSSYHDPVFAWIVDFYNGSTFANNKNGSGYFVRLVRSGP